MSAATRTDNEKVVGLSPDHHKLVTAAAQRSKRTIKAQLEVIIEQWFGRTQYDETEQSLGEKNG